MNFSEIKNGFISYLKQLTQFEKKEIDYNSLSIYTFKDEFEDYLNSENLSMSIFSLTAEDMSNIDFSINEAGNISISSEFSNENQQFTLGLLNELLSDENFVSQFDTDENGLDETELANMLEAINENDSNESLWSVADLLDEIEEIYGTEFVQEETAESPTSSTAPTESSSGGGNSGSSGVNGDSSTGTETQNLTPLQQALSDESANINTISGLAGQTSESIASGNLNGYNLTDEQKSRLTNAANEKNAAADAKENAQNAVQDKESDTFKALEAYDKAVESKLEAQEKVQDLQTQKESINEEKDTVQENRNSVNEAHDVAAQNVQTCQSEVSSAQSTVNSTPQTITQAAGTDEDGNTIYEEVENPDYADAVAALEAAKSALSAAEAEEQNLQAQLDELDSQLEDLSSQLAELDTNLRTAETKLNEANREAENAKQKADALDVAADSAEAKYRDAINDYQSKGAAYNSTKQTIMNEVKQAQIESETKLKEESQKEIDANQKDTDDKMTYADLMRLKINDGKADENTSDRAQNLWDKYQSLIQDAASADGKNSDVMKVIEEKFGSENNFLNALSILNEDATVTINGKEVNALDAITNKDYMLDLDNPDNSTLANVVNAGGSIQKVLELAKEYEGLTPSQLKAIIQEANEKEGLTDSDSFKHKFYDGLFCADFVTFLISETYGKEVFYDPEKYGTSNYGGYAWTSSASGLASWCENSGLTMTTNPSEARVGDYVNFNGHHAAIISSIDADGTIHITEGNGVANNGGVGTRVLGGGSYQFWHLDELKNV